MNESLIPPSELPLNADGSAYHIALKPEEVADTVITVGDPGRVLLMNKYFDHIECEKHRREFVSITGRVGEKRITVISTGIGPDNIDIVLNELDVLVNIDLKTRMIKPEKKSLQVIRLGTSGAMQENIPVDSIVLSAAVIGMDNLMHFYEVDWTEEETGMRTHLHQHLALTDFKEKPYCASADSNVLKKFSSLGQSGITVTCPGFYGPQGRQLRGVPAHKNYLDTLRSFRFGNWRTTNFEMETSAIYGLSRMLGHRALSISYIVANRITHQFSADHSAGIDKMISNALDLI